MGARRELLDLTREMESALTKRAGASRLEALVGGGSGAPTQVIRIEDIEVRPQIRKEFDEGSIECLAKSLKEHGLLQPIVVAKKREGGFLLVAGERRLRAAKKLGWFSIPAVVVDEGDEDRLKLMQLIENVQRKDLNLVEKSEGIWEYYKYMWKVLGGTGSPDVSKLWTVFYYLHGGKKDKIKGELEIYYRVAAECSTLVGLPDGSVLLHCLIANLEDGVKEVLANADKVSATHLRILFINKKPEGMASSEVLETIKKIQEEGISRRELERLLKGRKKGPAKKKDPFEKVDSFLKGLQKEVGEDLERVLKYLIHQSEAMLLRIKATEVGDEEL